MRRYFQSPDGQSVNGIQDVESAAIAALLADGWLEVPCMHPGAAEIVWKRPDSTISVTTVLPETLAQMEQARSLLALDRQVVADAVTSAEAALADALAAIEAADRAVSAGAQASKLRLQVRAQIQGLRDQESRQLAELQREASAAMQALDLRDAELAALERAGVPAQAELLQQQARELAAANTAAEARAGIDSATAAIAQADQALAALQAALENGTAGETVAADMSTALAARQAADTSLAAERARLVEADRLIADAGAAIGNLQQVIAQAAQATAERAILRDTRSARNAQDDAAAAAIRSASSVFTLEQNDTQLVALEVAAVNAENGMDALLATHEAKKTALAQARKTVADIADAEQTSATTGTTLDEHAQMLKAGGAVPTDWTMHAIHPAEAAWRPAGVEIDDLVIDAQGAVVADAGKVLARQAARFEVLVQKHLDAGAQSLGYDNIVSACSYAASPNPFQTEAQAFVTWRGAVWAKCYEVLAAVKAGTRPVPGEAGLLAELPVFGV